MFIKINFDVNIPLMPTNVAGKVFMVPPEYLIVLLQLLHTTTLLTSFWFSFFNLKWFQIADFAFSILNNYFRRHF